MAKYIPCLVFESRGTIRNKNEQISNMRSDKMKFLALFFLGLVGFAFADDASGVEMIKSYSILGAMIGLGIAAFGGAIGMGNAAAATITGTARNPGVGGKLLTTMFVAMAMIEAQVIYTLVFAIIAIYSNPFLS